jgi:hypothetical protein
VDDFRGINVFKFIYYFNFVFIILFFSSCGGSGGSSTTGSTQSPDTSETIKFVAVGTNGTIITSTDGDDWVLQSSGTTETLYNVRYLNSKIIIVGANGTLLTSDDATTWTSVNTSTTSYLQDIFYRNNEYIAVGGNEGSGGSIIITSSNLSSWTKIVTVATRELTGIIFFDQRYQVVAGGGSTVTGQSIGNSTDGASWAFTGTSFSQNKALYSLATDSSNEYAVGVDGLMIKSNDYFNWSTVSTGSSSDFRDIIHKNNLFMVVGRSPHVILKSSDGTNWSDISVSSGENLLGVTYGNSSHIAVGENGAIYKSTDATNWVSKSSPNSNVLYNVESIE